MGQLCPSLISDVAFPFWLALTNRQSEAETPEIAVEPLMRTVRSITSGMLSAFSHKRHHECLASRTRVKDSCSFSTSSRCSLKSVNQLVFLNLQLHRSLGSRCLTWDKTETFVSPFALSNRTPKAPTLNRLAFTANHSLLPVGSQPISPA
jgi:hypothetical protein